MDKCPYNIGDTFYVAEARSWERVKEPCPVCFGKRSIVVILGDGEHVPCECGYCRKGYDGPTGTATISRATSYVLKRTVAGIVKEPDWRNEGAWRIHDEQDHSYRLPNPDVFDNREDAERRREELFARAKEQADSAHAQHKRSETAEHGWTVGYHRREIREMERRIEWHRAKLREHRPEPKGAKHGPD